MKTLMEEWLFEGKISPYCFECAHFLVGSEPRMVSQPVVAYTNALYRGRFIETCKTAPVCNECFYHDDWTPSNFSIRKN